VQDRPYRTLLYVPGTKPKWLDSVRSSDADAIVIDLEDAVAENEKPVAREQAAVAIPKIADSGKGVFVRINGLDTPHWLDDVHAVVVAGLTGLAVPKVDSPGQVHCVSYVLDALEPKAGIDPGWVDIQPLVETAAGAELAFEVLRASPRVRSYWAGSARDGDVTRELGSRWRHDGRETLFLRSRLLLAGRAAGVPFPISGTWTEIQDQAGLTGLAEESRDLGYVGMYVLHPSHVEIVNRVFTPGDEELAHYREIIAAYAEAEKNGLGAAMLGPSMIDKAMVDRAMAVLRASEQLQGSDTGGAQ
jgi:citrate lyase subunit beta / citryl-CoA lyase